MDQLLKDVRLWELPGNQGIFGREGGAKSETPLCRSCFGPTSRTTWKNEVILSLWLPRSNPTKTKIRFTKAYGQNMKCGKCYKNCNLGEVWSCDQKTIISVHIKAIIITRIFIAKRSISSPSHSECASAAQESKSQHTETRSIRSWPGLITCFILTLFPPAY